MAHSEICPVCQGKGKLEDKQVTHGEKTCHGCNGRGWVEVQDSGFPFISCEPPEPKIFEPYWAYRL